MFFVFPRILRVSVCLATVRASSPASTVHRSKSHMRLCLSENRGDHALARAIVGAQRIARVLVLFGAGRCVRSHCVLVLGASENAFHPGFLRIRPSNFDDFIDGRGFGQSWRRRHCSSRSPVGRKPGCSFGGPLFVHEPPSFAGQVSRQAWKRSCKKSEDESGRASIPCKGMMEYAEARSSQLPEPPVPPPCLVLRRQAVHQRRWGVSLRVFDAVCSQQQTLCPSLPDSALHFKGLWRLHTRQPPHRTRGGGRSFGSRRRHPDHGAVSLPTASKRSLGFEMDLSSKTNSATHSCTGELQSENRRHADNSSTLAINLS